MRSERSANDNELIEVGNSIQIVGFLFFKHFVQKVFYFIIRLIVKG
jgi:hypothetical protein